MKVTPASKVVLPVNSRAKFLFFFFFFSSRRRHTRFDCDWIQTCALPISLTTVTFFWVLSDFLSRKTGSLDITAKLMQGSGISDLELLAGKEETAGSDAALWMLLLLRLTTVSSDDRLELRNSAIQTLLRIFDAYGERLNPEAWSISVKSVLFKLLTSLEAELREVRNEDAEESERADWNGTAVVVVDGMSTLLADYLDVLLSHPAFGHLWRE